MRRGRERRESQGGGQRKGKVEKKTDRAITTLINTHLDEVGTSPANLFLLTDLSYDHAAYTQGTSCKAT